MLLVGAVAILVFVLFRPFEVGQRNNYLILEAKAEKVVAFARATKDVEAVVHYSEELGLKCSSRTTEVSCSETAQLNDSLFSIYILVVEAETDGKQLTSPIQYNIHMD